MLYLFGRLALSDSLDYHESFLDDDARPAMQHERTSPPEPDARATAADRQLCHSAHLPPADRASLSCCGQ